MQGRLNPITSSFNEIASVYDEIFTYRLPAFWMRKTVHRVLQNIAKSKMRLLDLGCGSGEDACWAAMHGLRVTAVDISPEMIKVARKKALKRGLQKRIHFIHLDINMWIEEKNHVQMKEIASSYHVILLNFGVINLIPNIHGLARELAPLCRPGGHLLMTVLNRTCVWEILYHLGKGSPSKALRRFRKHAIAHIGSAIVPVHYPSPKTLIQAFTPWFDLESRKPIGITLPPSYLAHYWERHPRILHWLHSCEEWLNQRGWGTFLADHTLFHFIRKSQACAENLFQSKSGDTHEKN